MELNNAFPPDKKFAFEERNGKIVRQYSSSYAMAYDKKLKGMIETRMRMSIFTVASFWYSAWVDSGQPDLTKLPGKTFSNEDLKEFELLNQSWKSNEMMGRKEE
jgi:protein tyrosine phosphatase